MIWCHESRNLEERQLLNHLNTTHPVLVTDQNERIVAVNNSWITMCQYAAEEAFGKTPRMLQGPLTNIDVALDFAMRLRGGEATFMTILNYKKDASVFFNYVYGWSMGDLLIAETYMTGDRSCQFDEVQG